MLTSPRLRGEVGSPAIRVRGVLDRFEEEPLTRTLSPQARGEGARHWMNFAPQLRHASSDRRGAGRAGAHARGPQRRGAGGAARRRQDHAGAAGAARCAVGCKTRKSSCWSRGGSRPAPAPSGWQRRWASASARPSATASGSARKCRARPGSKSSPKASSPGRFSTIRNCPASPRCCSTSFTSARSMPIWAWRWRATPRSACARTCASS